MSHRITSLALFLTLVTWGCAKKDPLYCASDEDCEDNPGRPYCDLVGDLPGSEGLAQTCVADPGGDAGVPDAGPDLDASSCVSCSDLGATCGAIDDQCGQWITCGDPCSFAFRQLLEAPEPTFGNYFGDAVTITGSSIVVGASAEDTDLRTAEVHLFERISGQDQWQYNRKLTTGGNSGSPDTLASSEDTLVIGNPVLGNVRIFDHSGSDWTQTGTVTVPGAANGFGYRVAVDHDLMVVAESSSAAYVLRRNQTGWQNEKTIDLTAQGVAVSGDVVLANSSSFGVFAYRWAEATGWGEPVLLTGVGSFGADAAVRGDWLAVGAPRDDEIALDAGAVFLYRRSTSGWMQERKLLPASDFTGVVFGQVVEVDGSFVFVSSSVGVHVFQVVEGSWVETQMLEVSLPRETRYANGILVIGVPSAVNDEGAVYVYELVN